MSNDDDNTNNTTNTISMSGSSKTITTCLWPIVTSLCVLCLGVLCVYTHIYIYIYIDR